MKPNVKQHKDAEYFRALVAKTGMTKTDISKKLGITYRSLCNHCNNGAPYLVQFAVECLVYGD